MQNLELKAKYPDLALAHHLALSLGAVFTWTKRQRDIYWHAENGMLKLRQQDDEAAQLISYQRPKEMSARISHYLKFLDRSLSDISKSIICCRVCSDVEK